MGPEDVVGLAGMLSSCKMLHTLDLRDNNLQRLTERQVNWARFCDALSANRTLTSLNMNSNRLQAYGVGMLSKALLACSSLRWLGLSYNEPGAEVPALASLLATHESLVCVELVEELARHLPNRARDEIGRALMESKVGKLGFLSCDMFNLDESTEVRRTPLTGIGAHIAGLLQPRRLS